MKKIAVVLSGCGFKDGSEITEATSTLIALSEQGADYQCFAPNKDIDTVDHITDKASGQRNILQESSRICRGNIKELSELSEENFDALVFPGGFGAALHLCTWAQKGSSCDIMPKVQEIITQFHQTSKPIGAICIAPVLLAKTLGSKEVTLTIGEDKETAQEIEKTGAHHENCPVDDYITDRENKIVTTPAYMYDQAKPNKVFQGISGLIKELVEMA